MDSYAKLQAAVETATYGSEFSSARTAAEQMVGHRMLLRYLGAPARDQMCLFGDNKSVVASSAAPQSTLSKRHQALSYHYVRALIASGVLKFTHIPGENNPADILTKHWGHSQIWPLLKPLLFYQGDTADLIEDTSPSTREGSNVNPVVSTSDQTQPDKESR